jgi:hypothetical protein
MNRVALFTVLIAAAFAPAAGALSPVLPETMLCSSSYIFVGRVLEAQPEPLRRDGMSTQFSVAWQPVSLTIEVREVLGVALPPSRLVSPMILSSRDTIRGRTEGPVIPGASRMSKYSEGGGLRFDADHPLSDELIVSAYTGEDFIFSVRMMAIGRPYGISIWPASRKSWVLETMARFPRSQATADYSCPSRVDPK